MMLELILQCYIKWSARLLLFQIARLVGLLAASKDRILNNREEMSQLKQAQEQLQKTIQQVICPPNTCFVSYSMYPVHSCVYDIVMFGILDL